MDSKSTPAKSLPPQNLISRYFDRVLGVKSFSGPRIDATAEVAGHGVCLLVEVGSASVEQASLQQMGARMLEALRNEWLKKSTDALPEMQWCQASNEDWRSAVADASRGLKLAIVCGALGNTGARVGGESEASASSANVLHVPSFLEMNSSPALKREAWQAIQVAIQAAIRESH